MKKCGKLAAGVCLFAALLSGCGQAEGPKEITVPTLVIDGDGGVTAYLVGEFDKSYYDLSELKAMAEEEASAFSGASQNGKAAVTVESVEAVLDGSNRIVVTYRFDSADSYKGFIGNELFYGTVEEALARGYIQDVILQSAEGGAPVNREVLEKEKDRHLIITNAAAVIYCPNKVTHMSMGTVLQEDGSIDVSQSDGLVYILLKK